MTKNHPPESGQEHAEHVLLDCVPSKDGKVLTCKRVKPKNTSKIPQEETVTTVQPTESSSSDKGKTVQEHCNPDIPIGEDSDTTNAAESVSTDGFLIDCTECYDEPSENAEDITTVADDHLIEDSGADNSEGGLENE